MLLWKVIKTKDHFIWNSAARYGYLKIGLGCFYSWLDVWLFISHYCMYYSLYGSWLNHAIWLKTLFLSMMMIQLVIDRALQCFINSLQLSLFVLCDVYCSYWAMQLLFVCKVGDGIVGWWVRVRVDGDWYIFMSVKCTSCTTVSSMVDWVNTTCDDLSTTSSTTSCFRSLVSL